MKTNSIESLTPKELEILKLICQQYTSKQISIKINTGVKNVERYCSRLLTKTNTKNRAGLVVYAMRHNLFPDLVDD